MASWYDYISYRQYIPNDKNRIAVRINNPVNEELVPFLHLFDNKIIPPGIRIYKKTVSKHVI